MKHSTLRVGEVLYQSGSEAAPAVLAVRSGLVKVTEYAEDGTERILRLVRVGDAIGLEALLGEPYRHTASALRTCCICHISVSWIRRLLKQKPVAYQSLIRHGQRKLDLADRWRMEFSTGPCRAGSPGC